MRDLISATVFWILLVVLSPLFVIGYVLYAASLFTQRESGVSGTAQAPLLSRWFAHQFGTRPDEPAKLLLMVLPGVPRLGRRLVAGPLLLAHHVTGYVPSAFRYPFTGEISLRNEGAARQTFFDTVVERYRADIAQLVILGAGFDTRAFGLPEGTRVRSFEVDTPRTQAVKRAALRKAGIDATAVAFAAADFETEDWLARLVEAGFDPAETSLFLLEGVIPYLDPEAVVSTLCKIAGTAKDSIVAFDYFTAEVLESRSLAMRSIRASLSAGGEPLAFGVDSTPPSRERLAELLQSCGLALVEQRTFGQETEGKRAWGGFAIAIVSSQVPVADAVVPGAGMNKKPIQLTPPSDRGTMRPEYDFSDAKRGVTAVRYADGANVVVIDPEVLDVFPDAGEQQPDLKTRRPKQ